eukprot:TRINITY_DN13200_c0_g3_i2.p1 TRINITY_DN13200_c0_g3~~TRINITY_DN13200_c0_g3_i2.p1  ORF type:complete len:385 (-),score=69.65 TRINITY_DN13200_c0_g3_i2:277-1431(-)
MAVHKESMLIGSQSKGLSIRDVSSRSCFQWGYHYKVVLNRGQIVVVHQMKPYNWESTGNLLGTQVPQYQQQEQTSNQEKLDEEGLKVAVDRGVGVINEIVDEVNKEVMVEGLSSYVMEQDSQQQQDVQTVVKNIISSRIETLDESFLATLGACINVVAQQGDRDLAALLTLMKVTTIDLLKDRMPPVLRVLEEALAIKEKDKRLEYLESIIYGNQEDSEVGLESLLASSSGMVDDMEENLIIADRRLHASMVVLREELKDLDAQNSWKHDIPSKMMYRQYVPTKSMAFLKELMKVVDPLKSQALIAKSFNEEYSEEYGAQARLDNLKPGQAISEDLIRPGRFLTCLSVTFRELEQQGEGNEQVKQKLTDIRKYAMAVVQAMADE